jgi:serine protease inhibitor
MEGTMLRRKYERKVGALGAFSLVSNSGNNTAIAPLSVAIALQIAYNGAVGTTQQAMVQTLQLAGLTVSQLNGDNAALQASLLDPDPKVDLTIANSLWVHLSAHPLAPTVVSTDQNYYGAQMGDLAGAPADANAWVDTQTNGLISSILPTQAQVDYSKIVAILVNVIYLPRFTTSFSASLQQSLTALGMGIAFDPVQGNLSGINPGAFISDVEHKTVVEVNETGTVAVGATSVGIGTTAVQRPVNFAINHPFFYAIRDNTSGDLLFVGVLMNPGAG